MAFGGHRTCADCLRRSCDALAAEIRDFLVEKVSRTGGHLGPNLGVVELTLALHRVFDSPKDRLLFDTGHQAYVHKMVTGRQGGFDQLRQRGGLTGYPNQAESEHDTIENCHASTALSYADGLAKAYAIRGERRHVVAIVGDGALTGGMCWEALNNIAAARNPLVIVVNDNGRSYAPTIGGLADHLATLRLNPGYERVLDLVKDSLGRTPLVGGAAVRGAARGQEGHQGRGRPAGDVRGPRHQVRRPGRRARHRRAWRARCGGPRASARRSSCTRSPARGTATSRPRTTRSTGCTARPARSTR